MPLVKTLLELQILSAFKKMSHFTLKTPSDALLKKTTL